MESKDAKEILKAISGLDKRFDRTDKRLDAIEKDITEIKENVRKLIKVIPIENADFDAKIKLTKSKPTHSSSSHTTNHRMAAKPAH